MGTIIDPLAQARHVIADLPSALGAREAALLEVRTLAALAVAETLAAHKPPQGSGEPPSAPDPDVARATTPAPAEPSLVALDAAEELAGEVRRWREADRLFPCETTEWWDATLRLRDMADRLCPPITAAVS